jgi:hypothetical protein
MLMKTLNNLAALSLSFILGLMPFALIALNDSAVAKAEMVTVDAVNPVHALMVEGR